MIINSIDCSPGVLVRFVFNLLAVKLSLLTLSRSLSTWNQMAPHFAFMLSLVGFTRHRKDAIQNQISLLWNEKPKRSLKFFIFLRCLVCCFESSFSLFLFSRSFVCFVRPAPGFWPLSRFWKSNGATEKKQPTHTLSAVDEPTRESTIERCGERGVGSNGFSSLGYCHVNCEQFQVTLLRTSF